MKDQNKTKPTAAVEQQLIGELELRQRIAELEASDTERKRAEEALGESEQKYRFITEKMTDAVWLMDMEFNPTFISPSVTRTLGYTLEELQALSLNELLTPKSFESAMKTVATELAPERLAPRSYERSVTVELEFCRRDGSPLCVESTITLLRDSEGRPTGLMGVGRDITERKQAEEALRHREAQLSNAMKIAKMGYWESDIADDTLTFNDQFYSIFRTSAEQVGGYQLSPARYLELFVHPDDIPLLNAERKKSLEATGPSTSGQVEHRIIYGDGEIGYVSMRYFTVHDDQGRPVKTYGVVQDITERKQVEEALQESELRYRTTINAMGDSIHLVDSDLRLALVNLTCQQWAEDFASGATDVVGLTIFEAFPTLPDEARDRLRAEYHQVFSTGETLITEESTAFGDKEFITETRKIPVFENGRVIQVITIIRDITERKRAEEALREAHEQLTATLDALPDLLFEVDRDGRIYDYRASNPERLYVPPEQFLGKTVREVMPEAAADTISAAIAEATEHGQYRGGAYSLDMPTGLSSFELSIAAKGDPHAPGSHFIVLAHDITERKRAEEALGESEKKYRLVSENIPVAVYSALPDEHSTNLFMSGRTEELTGYSVQQFLENPDLWTDILHPEDTEYVWQKVREHRENKSQLDIEYRIITQDKKVKWLRDKATPALDENGNIIRIDGFMEDITERKQVEKERERLLVQIQEQARRIEQIVDTVPAGVLLLNAAGRVALANPAAEIALSVLADSKVGDTLTHLGDCPLAELLTSPPKGLWHEVKADVPHGQEERVFEVIARPMENGPEPEDWVLVVNDVTREREIQQHAQQQEHLAAVGQLAAGIAHDFNNIMATIILYAQMTARMAELPPAIRERMETINGQAQHATRLIQQILDFSRRAVLERQPLDLALLLKEHVKLLKRTLPESIEIELAYEPDAYMINADPTRMQQMVTNLTVNARDAMPGGGTLRIGLERIEVRPGKSPPLPEMETGAWVQVTVSDTGVGIPPDVLSHIFEPFFTTKAPLGSGLGLAQVHGIVGQHGGRIDVETQAGKGTTFTIYLPALPASPKPSGVSTPEELPTLPTGKGETILVVEDDATVRKALVESLGLLNYRTLEAANGWEALTTLEQRGDDVDLLLSDVVMPGMGGIALLHILKERGVAVKAVMLTGHPLEKEMEELRAQGMVDWLPKPPELERLAKVVARALDMD